MANHLLRHRYIFQSAPFSAEKSIHSLPQRQADIAPAIQTSSDEDPVLKKEAKGKWFTLPAYASSIDATALGKKISGRNSDSATAAATTTALQWILRSCPQLPRSLVQKLFRLRQVRRESSNLNDSGLGSKEHEHKLKRVAAKDSMNAGDRIFLPFTVQKFSSEKREHHYSEEETAFVQNLVFYKDPAIIVVNKPFGMPVQGGIGIKRSLDELAAACLRYDCSDPPRLVHRLDRDSSGILVMGRTQTSATLLHSIFREKTAGASNNDIGERNRILQRRYWALVIGTPRRRRGLISAPLGKVVVDDGKSERITVVDNSKTMSSQHAITEYRVIDSSCHGYTWLELSPLTGRKHQLRVHCAEVLRTPIVGDYKYGWQAHRKWQQWFCSYPEEDCFNEKPHEGKGDLDLDDGSISGKQPNLHLHCKHMIMPNVLLALQHAQLSSDCDLSQLESLELVAPLPPHMQRSWDILHS